MLEGYDFGFKPAQLKAKVGQPLTVVYRNTGAVVHDFTIDAIPVAVEGRDQARFQTQLVQSGGELRFTFTPKQAGRYKFYCSVPGHKTAGMVGTLVVEP